MRTHLGPVKPETRSISSSDIFQLARRTTMNVPGDRFRRYLLGERMLHVLEARRKVNRAIAEAACADFFGQFMVNEGHLTPPERDIVVARASRILNRELEKAQPCVAAIRGNAIMALARVPAARKRVEAERTKLGDITKRICDGFGKILLDIRMAGLMKVSSGEIIIVGQSD